MTLGENLQRLREEVHHKITATEGRIVQLSQELDNMREASYGNLPQHQMEMLEQTFTELSVIGIERRSLKVGDRVHDFSLPDVYGNIFHLRHALEKGPAVVSFFFGNWCPFCMLQLEVWQKYQPILVSLEVTNIAISPQLSGENLKPTKDFHLAYDILSDFDNRIAKLFGIAFRIPQVQESAIEQSGVSLLASNGNNSMELPANATFIIDRDRTIRYAFVDYDYTKRAEPMDIIDILLKMKNHSVVSS